MKKKSWQKACSYRCKTKSFKKFKKFLKKLRHRRARARKLKDDLCEVYRKTDAWEII